MTPALAELLAQLNERQRLDVESRNGLWGRYFREKVRWATPAGEEVKTVGNQVEVTGNPSLPSRLAPILEKAMLQKSVGSVLAIVRQALHILHEDESSKLLGDR